MIAISNFILNEGFVDNLKSHGRVIGNTVMSSLPSVLMLGGMAGMGLGALAHGDSPVAQLAQKALPYTSGAMMAGVALSVPQRLQGTANMVKNNYQRNRNQEMMRQQQFPQQYQQQNPQYFQRQPYPQQNYIAR